MKAELELATLLGCMRPVEQEGEFVFCPVEGNAAEFLHLEPLAIIREQEGLTLILPAEIAEQNQLSVSNSFKQITLTIHSSLDAVGLTAAVSAKLAACGISANLISAYYHDHIFVPAEKSTQALLALLELSRSWAQRMGPKCSEANKGG